MTQALTGGAGAEAFRFGAPGSKADADRITDVGAEDVIEVSAMGFGLVLATGAALTGALLWDAGGGGGGADAVRIAVLSGAPTLTAADFAGIA